MKKLIKDPLLHFLVIGALLFFSFEIFSKPADNSEQEIIVTQGEIDSLRANFKRTWQRPPTEKELDGLIENRVRDEIALREAKAMGLDRGDATIRRRMRMKLELLLEDIAGLDSPTEAELENYLRENGETFFIEPQFSFKQVYFSLDKQTAKNEMSRTLAALTEAGDAADPAEYGGLPMLPGEVPLSYASVIKRQFGESFVAGLQKAETGRWFGPIESGYGLHLVFVREQISGRFPKLSEVRKEVEREWTSQQRKKVREDAYRKLRKRYSVMIEAQQTPTGAQHGSDS